MRVDKKQEGGYVRNVLFDDRLLAVIFSAISCHDRESQSHDSKIAAVKLVHNSKVLLDWYAINMQKGITFVKLLEDVTHANARGED